MPLPILQSSKYTAKIPSTGKTIEYRPFLVKEEKILLVAQESNDSTQMFSAMKEIIRACTFEKLDVDDITSFDLEYIFMKLRAKSIGEYSDIYLDCSECSHSNSVSVQIDNIEVSIDPELSKTIMLTDTIGVTMRNIRVKDMALLSDESKPQSEIINNVVMASIESIFDADNVYPSDKSTPEELTTFINSLNRSQMSKIEAFIQSSPKLEKNVQFTCSKCKHENSIVLSGTQSFFA
jgi:transcription elongation factor Elf1